MPPPAHGYEFGGPLGAFAISLSAPAITYAFYFICSEDGCPSSSFLRDPVGNIASKWPGLSGAFDWDVTKHYFLWYLALVAMYFVLPGKTGEGVVLSNGKRLKYKFNGYASMLTVWGYCGFMTFKEGFGWPLWAYLWDNQLQLMTGALIFSIPLAFYCYISSLFTGELLANNTGNFIYDWFLGRPLNPRIGRLDLKVFSELRPGMILWPILNFASLAHQYSTHGKITDSMILVNFFHLWYVYDALHNEPAVLTTMDVTTDGFGFMLSFGDLMWLPFNYSIQCRYLAMHPFELGPLGVAGVLAVQGLGYWIFREANREKHEFRSDPNDPRLAHIKYIETKSGSRLMITGWWGIARHINYMGDWIMAWAWCLPTGYRGPLSYFYVVYFAILLLHRERRDEAKCKLKYGADWKRYTDLVPSRIIPGIY
ncbi:ERG4/ERG24 ergosterol biosynthesis protein [Tuber magnatum]|uniref:Delta(14)-sterol reductase n=1 Tax=Tuber magnatum TaxID=42249 RepID=A0A317SG92_9PEZI|nr:ERG4/ERG24 ergosterol biosynthesis protein [Tuber magnatum]